MIRVGISAALEKRIRSGENVSPDLVLLMDRVREAARTRAGAGVGYQDIVRLLREGLGDRLAVPANPTTAWIIRQVSRARELGLDEQQIQRLGRLAARQYGRGAVDIEFVLRSATRILQAPGGGVSSGNQEDAGGDGDSVVWTGRPDD